MMKFPFVIITLALFSGPSMAKDIAVDEVITDCINRSAVVKLALAEFYDMGEGAQHRFPEQQEFEEFSAVREAAGNCRFVFHGEGSFEIDFDEQSLGFGSRIQPRITATPQALYDEKRAIDFHCSRGQTAEPDLGYLPESCRGEN